MSIYDTRKEGEEKMRIFDVKFTVIVKISPDGESPFLF